MATAASKKKNGKIKKEDNEVKVMEVAGQQQNLSTATSLTLVPLSNDLQLSSLHQSLVLSYFKEVSLNQIVGVGDALTFSIYGKKHSFRIIHAVNSQNVASSNAKGEKEQVAEKLASDEGAIKEEEGQQVPAVKYIISKKTTFRLANIEITNKPSENTFIDTKNSESQQSQGKEEIIVLAGVSAQQEEIQNYIKLSLFQFSDFNDLGFSPIKGILLYGSSGTGKTQLMKKLSETMTEVRFIMADSKQFLSRLVGEGEKNIEGLFSLAKKSNEYPTVLFFDDLHVICDKSNKGLISTLSAEIDNLKPNNRVLVVCATSQPKKIDETLRRSGRLDKEIAFEIPKTGHRLAIFQSYLARCKHSLNDEDINDINQQMNGFSGADVVSLLRETLLQRIKDAKDTLDKAHFEEALQNVHPTGVKEILMDIPKVFWRDIGGYSSVKDQIKQVIEWPLKHPDAFKRMGIQPSKGILLYGPPGCSKTMIAKAIATESKLNFLAVKGPELFSKYVGDSEKALREVFRRARLCAPAVIFFDEIDAIATQRSAGTDVSERVLCQLLNEMDGIEGLKNVVIIAATNRPEIIDKALTRPGRFDHLIYVPPPDLECRREILRINILGNSMPVKEGDLDIEELAKATDGYSGAEITLIVREAGLHALSRDIYAAQVDKQDFLDSIAKVKPRITQEMLLKYTSFANNLKFF